MAANEPEDLITQAEAARIRGVTRSAIGYLIAQQRLRTYERFGMRFVSRAEVEGYEPLKPGPVPGEKSRSVKTGATKKGTAKKGGKK